MLRRMLYAAIALLVLMLGAEISLTLLSQRGLERALTTQYGLPPDTDVNISSFPFLMSFMRGRISELRISWNEECMLSSRDSRNPVGCRYTVFLHDVSLSLPSLFRGEFRLSSLSRMKASMEVDASLLVKAVNLGDLVSITDKDGITVSVGGIQHQYKVKITGSRDGVFYHREGSSGTVEGENGAEGGLEPDVVMFTVQNPSLGADLKSASICGSSVVFELSIPEWEDVIHPYSPTLRSNHEDEL